MSNASTPKNPIFPPYTNDLGHSFLQGGGQLGEQMRTFDWSTTSLGPVEGWPWSLRSALSICLGSSFPIAIYWGKDLILLYNDAWSPIPGSKHPWALGRAAQEVWPEIWPTIGPLFEQVLQGGEATRSQDELLPMRRHGYTEECYFDYTFTAIRGEDGRVGGIFNAVIETTFRVIHARRTTLLAQLSKQINQVRSREEVWPVAIDSLATDPKDIPCCLLYTIDPASPAWGVLMASTGVATPFTRVPLGEANPASGKDLLLPGWPTAELLAGKGTYQVIDLTTLPEPLPQGPWPEPCQQAIVFPLFVIAGNPTGYMVAGISSRRKLDADYIQFYESVAQQLSTALANVHALEQERKKAEALSEIDKAKTVFFSNISHEFRTPLTLMLAPLAELLANPSLAPKHRDTLQLVHRNSLRLLRLVNTLLDFSRLEAGRMKAFFKPVDLSGLTGELSSMFRSSIEQAGLAFEVNCAPVRDPVYVDESLWERILFNLLSNAFKFTLQGSITVSLAQVGQQVVLRVQDTGTGIPPEELPKLFSRFHRVENAVGRTHEGSGIGLAMVYELVKLHGGTVSVESTAGEGSTFTVSILVGKDHLSPTQVASRETPGRRTLNALPDLEEELGLFTPLPSPEEALPDQVFAVQTGPVGLEKEQLAAGSSDAFIQTTLTPEIRPLVLVADDNPDMRQFLVRLLEEHYQVRAVRDGNEALQAVGQTLPDLILSDVMMPHLDGLGLLKALRADRRTAALPVMLLSARAGEESTIAGMDAGADDYLIKPFSAPELLSRVQAQLKLAALRKALHQKDQLLLTEVDRQQQRLESLLMEAPAPIVILDGPELIFQLVNPAYQRIFPGRQLLGKPLLEALPEVATTPIPMILGQVYRSGETYVAQEVPLMLARKEGEPVEEIYWTFTYQARRNTGGQVDGVLVFAYEVTDQVRARQAIEESQKQFKILSEAIPQLVWTATPAGAITYCNPQWYAYTGLSEEQSLGQGWTSAFHPEDLPHLLEHWQHAIQTGKSYQTEARLKSGQGAYRWFLLRALPLPDEQGSIKQWFGTDTDIHDRKLAEETLRESEAQLRLMADAVPQIVWLTDWEGRVEFFNKQWTRYTGAAYEPTTAAQVAASFVHPQDSQLTMEAFAQAQKAGSIFSVEHRIRSAEGNYRWFLVRAEPYRDPNTGEILRWFGASIDIHDQKLAQQALQESEERFRIMADAAPNIVWALHPDGTQKYLNKFGLQYLGVTLQEALALNWTPFIHAEDLAATSQAVSGAIEHQQPYRQEHRLRRHDGEYRWYLAQGAPSYYPSGELYGYVGSGIDITELKLAEQRLQLLSEELAAANGELRAANEEIRASNQELLQANQRLSRVNADLDNFIYTASHDLKAPILNIEGLLKVLTRKVSVQSGQQEQLSHILHLMEDSVSRFKETISDLTDIARIQKQLDLASEPVNLREMIEITLLDLTQVIEEAGARIENHLEESHTVMFPRKNLKSVLYNLLSNAVKYRDSDRALLIRIYCRTEGDYFILNVQDNGLGMDTRDPDKIFGMFKRQHAHVEGTGVGLYIVKKMIENAGGKIEVESQVGVGSTFGVYFKLP